MDLKHANLPSFNGHSRRRRRNKVSRYIRKVDTKLPFGMNEMVEQGKITQEACDKLMQMFSSTDPEIDRLATTMIRKLKGYE